MNEALTTAYSYVISKEGVCGVMTIIVLALACVVMLTCMNSYPELIAAFELAG